MPLPEAGRGSPPAGLPGMHGFLDAIREDCGTDAAYVIIHEEVKVDDDRASRLELHLRRRFAGGYYILVCDVALADRSVHGHSQAVWPRFLAAPNGW